MSASPSLPIVALIAVSTLFIGSAGCSNTDEQPAGRPQLTFSAPLETALGPNDNGTTVLLRDDQDIVIDLPEFAPCSAWSLVASGELGAPREDSRHAREGTPGATGIKRFAWAPRPGIHQVTLEAGPMCRFHVDLDVQATVMMTFFDTADAERAVAGKDSFGVDFARYAECPILQAITEGPLGAPLHTAGRRTDAAETVDRFVWSKEQLAGAVGVHTVVIAPLDARGNATPLCSPFTVTFEVAL